MFDVDSCVCFITNKVSKKMIDKLNERLVLVGSTRVQWLVMYYLSTFGKMTQRELADKMNIKDSTVVRLIDRMEKEEIVQRVKDYKDRRVRYLMLTEKGEKRIEELLPIAEEMSVLFSKGISEEEFEIFNKVLNKMGQNAES